MTTKTTKTKEPKRVLITGSRTFKDRNCIKNALLDIVAEYGRDAILVTGACPKGADRIAEEIWRSLFHCVEKHPADWEKYGKRAGFIRNQFMVDLGADLCLAFRAPEGEISNGTDHCIAAAKKAGIPVRMFYDKTTK